MQVARRLNHVICKRADETGNNCPPGHKLIPTTPALPVPNIFDDNIIELEDDIIELEDDVESF